MGTKYLSMKKLLKYVVSGCILVVIIAWLNYSPHRMNPSGAVGENIESPFDKVEDSSNKQKIIDSLKLTASEREYVKCPDQYNTAEAHADALARFVSEEVTNNPDVSEGDVVSKFTSILEKLGCPLR